MLLDDFIFDEIEITLLFSFLQLWLKSFISGEAEKEYWSLLRSNQEKHHRDFKGNRGRFAHYITKY